jgi:hypothetical protein
LFHKGASDALAFRGGFPYIGFRQNPPTISNRESHRMTTFDERENAFENMYAHDAEMQFRAEARRNKLLGLWAAERMGLGGDAAEAYAKSVVVEDLKEAGDHDVFRKVAADLAAKGAGVPEAELRRRMAELLSAAKVQIVTETGS